MLKTKSMIRTGKKSNCNKYLKQLNSTILCHIIENHIIYLKLGSIAHRYILNIPHNNFVSWRFFISLPLLYSGQYFGNITS